MAASENSTRIILGDPVPWFSAPLVGEGAFNLQVAAGRWIVLAFLGSPANPRVQEELTALLQEAKLFHEDRIVFYGVLTAPPREIAHYTALNTSAISFIADYDGAVSRAFGAAEMPRTVVLDPMLRAITDIPWDYAAGHAQSVRSVLQSLPPVDDAAGVPLLRRCSSCHASSIFSFAISSSISTKSSAARIPGFCSIAQARRRRWWITGSSAAPI